MTGAMLGSLVAALGAVALVVALSVRRATRDLALQRSQLFDWQGRLERREADLAAYARDVHEWEGRLLQVAVCGCDPHTLDERRVRPDRTPPRGPRPGRPPTRRG